MNVTLPTRVPRIFLFSVGLILLGLSSAHAFVRAGWQEVAAHVDTAERQLTVVVPEGATRIALHVRTAKGRWVRWKTLRVRDAQTEVEIRIRPSMARRAWRAQAEIPSSRKFPDNFYKGKRSFARTPSAGYGEGSLFSGFGLDRVYSGIPEAQPLPDGATSEPVVEADIWKADGSTVFFFNQLRGLQVIDLSNPRDPGILAALRLPAVGQDLYVLPSAGPVRHVVLLARDPGDWNATVVHLVRVEGGQATSVATCTVQGMLADSRMKGRRLFLATQRWGDGSSHSPGHALIHDIFVDPVSDSLTLAAPSAEIEGASPVVAAGDNWMAIAVNDWSNWSSSHVTVFALSESGLRKLTPEPLRTSGAIKDQFKMHVRGDVFTAITEGWAEPNEDEQDVWGVPVARLENFRTTGARLAELEIIRGEQLFATRFDGNKAYAVTFEQVDPLWIIDLTEATAPAITGHLEVPGWSTHLEPLGDLLFSIGWDEGRVAASLFDVSDPGNPSLASRIFLSDAWAGFSESLYDEKALKILRDRNLALVPFTLGNPGAGDSGHRIQILQIDPGAKTLALRGRITHDFEPRRAAMVGGSLASISQRQIVTADISNPHQPVVLSDLLLAWPVDRLALFGDRLLQIAAGSVWNGQQAVLRISPVSEPDVIESEFTLGEGIVRDAVVRGDRLHILRSEGGTFFPPWRVWQDAWASSRIWPGIFVQSSATSLHLDTYDLSALPELTALGSLSFDLEENSTGWETGRLIFPVDNTAVVLARTQLFRWGYLAKTISIATAADGSGVASVAASLPFLPNGESGKSSAESANAVVFDLIASQVRSIPLPEKQIPSLDRAAALDGLVVFGSGERMSGLDDTSFAPRRHFAAVLDVTSAEAAAFRSFVPLPGRLLAISDLDRRGFLAWTEMSRADGLAHGVQVSACDLQSAFLVASADIKELQAVDAKGRALFAAAGSSVRRLTLLDSGLLQDDGQLPLEWQPYDVRAMDHSLLASDGIRLVHASLDSFPAATAEWTTSAGLDLRALDITPEGTLVSPAGDFGVDLFR